MGLNFLAYPDYLSFKQRVNSFTWWPHQLAQKNINLAHAGFFYSNMGDKVTCFACGVKLYGWNIRDDPWIEHYKYARHCVYLEMVGGVRIVSGSDTRLRQEPQSHNGTGTDEPDGI